MSQLYVDFDEFRQCINELQGVADSFNAAKDRLARLSGDDWSKVPELNKFHAQSDRALGEIGAVMAKTSERFGGVVDAMIYTLQTFQDVDVFAEGEYESISESLDAMKSTFEFTNEYDEED